LYSEKAMPITIKDGVGAGVCEALPCGEAFPCLFEAGEIGRPADARSGVGDEFGPVERRRWRKERKQILIALIDSRPLILDALAHRFKIAIRGSRILHFATAEDLLGNPAICDRVDLVMVSARSAHVVSGEILGVVRQLCATVPEKPVIIITERDEADAIAAMMREGARGCIPTSCALPVAVAALEVVMAGGTFAPVASLINAPAASAAASDPAERKEAARGPSEDPPDGDPAGEAELTAREIEVLACLAKGDSNKMIARELRLREGTVKVHVRHLMAKLKAANRTQLALRSHRLLADNGRRE
jgi:DNA-binding NarL/FixJ family response regulator